VPEKSAGIMTTETMTWTLEHYLPWSEDRIHAQSYLNREGGGRTRFPVLSDVEPACHLAERGVITIEIDRRRMRLIG
jgi:hypothetical protein